jgi:hypothetical protein
MLKSIEGFPNYLISSEGKVYKLGRESPLKTFKNVDGYHCICLTYNGERKHKRVCRLVAEHFVENPHNKPVVNHKNLIRDDDRCENLEWVTTEENNRHGILNNPDAHRTKSELCKEVIHEVCKYLSLGLRAKDVSEITGVRKDIIDHVSKGVTWKDVSCQYNMPSKSSRVSITSAKWVLRQISNGMTYHQILEKSSNSRLTIELIEMIDKRLVFKELEHPSSTIPKGSTLKRVEMPSP